MQACEKGELQTDRARSTMLAQWEHSCYEVQGKSTLSDKILTEKEKFRLGYSENPDF